jgi:hypothetical protein
MRPWVWSYHYLDHLRTAHPLQLLTKAEKASYPISVEELEGVFGKEFGLKGVRRK